MSLKKSVLPLLATTAMVFSAVNIAQAREQIRIVGSSTVVSSD